MYVIAIGMRLSGSGGPSIGPVSRSLFGFNFFVALIGAYENNSMELLIKIRCFWQVVSSMR